MAGWNHSICSACWEKREPDRYPLRVSDDVLEECCFCGTAHASGIYVRGDPQFMKCQHAEPVSEGSAD